MLHFFGITPRMEVFEMIHSFNTHCLRINGKQYMGVRQGSGLGTERGGLAYPGLNSLQSSWGQSKQRKERGNEKRGEKELVLRAFCRGKPSAHTAIKGRGEMGHKAAVCGLWP